MGATTPVGQAGPGIRAVGAALRVTMWFSPRPTAMVVRRAFAQGVVARTALLEERAPQDVMQVLDEPYGAGRDEVLDVYVPTRAANTGERLPTVVWTHGGAFVGGSKEELSGWLRALADAGPFTVVAPRYSRAPEQRYPAPVRQVSAATAHVLKHADRYRVDPDRVVLAGDSAGAQISAQVAAIATSPAYARDVGVRPALQPGQLRGVVLCCGIYDLADVPETSPLRMFLLACGWAYSGVRRFRSDEPFMSGVSVGRHVDENFPPAFVTCGNADPLLPQSRALAARLALDDVPLETLFFADDHEPRLGHEYQFDLGTPAADEALARIVDFVRKSTAPA